MAGHYGYVIGKGAKQKGNDGDAVDIFMGPTPESELVFVVDQSKPDGSFDEHKAVAGVLSEAEAKKLYMDSYSAGWKGFRGITPMTLAQFHEWLMRGNMMRPVSESSPLPGTSKLEEAAKILWETEYP